MLHIVTALHFEAKPLIEYYGLRKLVDIAAFDVFASEQIQLIVSGIGRLNAAIATTYLQCALNGGTSPELILNLGVCGTTNAEQIGQLFQINRIIDRATQKSFVPEMFLKTNLPERTLETWDRTALSSSDLQDVAHLVDMEAFAVCEAASKFTPLERIQCLKIPSDTLKHGILSAELVHELIWQQISVIAKFIDLFAEQRQDTASHVLETEDLQILADLQEALRLTRAQQHTLLQRAHAYKVCASGSLQFLLSYLTAVPSSREKRKSIYRQILHELSAS